MRPARTITRKRLAILIFIACCVLLSQSLNGVILRTFFGSVTDKSLIGMELYPKRSTDGERTEDRKDEQRIEVGVKGMEIRTTLQSALNDTAVKRNILSPAREHFPNNEDSTGRGLRIGVEEDKIDSNYNAELSVNANNNKLTTPLIFEDMETGSGTIQHGMDVSVSAVSNMEVQEKGSIYTDRPDKVKRKNLILVGHDRSGTTFSTQVFNNDLNTFTIYEPFWFPYDWKRWETPDMDYSQAQVY